MIYLIGGVGRAGKSYVARKIQKRLGISYFSTDWFPLPPIIELLFKMIANQIDDGVSGVFEGTAITPRLFLLLRKNFREKIHGCFLGYKDLTAESKLEELERNRIESGHKGWPDFPGMSETLVRGFIDESKRLYSECENHNILYYEIDNIVGHTEKIISLLTA